MIILAVRINQHAHDLGFELAGIAPATPADGFDELLSWLEQGFAGEMNYMHRHAEARRHPSSILPEVRSVVMVGMNYKPDTRRAGCVSPLVAPSNQGAHAPRSPGARKGQIARYARGEDYHDVLRRRLNQL